MTKLPLAAAAGVLFLAAAVLASARTLVLCGTLLDGVSDAPQKEMTVVIDGQRIAAVQAGYATAAAGDTVFDLKHATVTPGWIDCHVHLDSETSPKFYTEQFYQSPGDYALHAAYFAKKTLLAGFTTVRNVGDTNYSTVALRDAIAAGWVEGPRVFTAGTAMGTTGSHADPTNGFNDEVMRGMPAPQIFDGADAARAAVREHYKHRVDLIKVMATAGVLSLEKNGAAPQISVDEIKAVVETAHECGLKVAVHAHGAEGIKRAVEAGVDSIEHGTYMNDEIMTLMKQHGTYYVPTLSAGHYVVGKAKEPGFLPAIVVPKALEMGGVMTGTFQRAYHAGVKIAFGTDQGVAPHGENAKEFVYMVEAGMPPMTALKCATAEAAKLIGDEKDLGTIQPGKYADLVAVPGDVLADINLVTKVNFVMKAGTVYRDDAAESHHD